MKEPHRLWSQMGVSINGGTPEWMDYKDKSIYILDDQWGTTIYGNRTYGYGWQLKTWGTTVA